MDMDEVARRFTFDKPATEAQVGNHVDIRDACARVAHQINNLLPDGREKSLALTKLEEASFWANAGLARSR